MNLWSYSDPKFLFGFFFLTMLELQHSRFCNWHFQHRQHLLTFCCYLVASHQHGFKVQVCQARCFVLLVSLFAVRSDVGFFNFFGAPFHISFFVLGGFLFDGFFDLLLEHIFNWISWAMWNALCFICLNFGAFFVCYKVCAWNLKMGFTSFLFLVIVKSWSSFVLARLCFFISYCISICVSGLNSHFWEAVINLLFLSLGDFFSCLLSLAWQCF